MKNGGITNLLIRFSRAFVAGCLIFAGCTAHKQAASQPPFAPTSENAIRVLSSVPRSGYDKLGTVTVLQDLAEPANRNFVSVREIAARAGANAVFMEQERVYAYRSGFNQCTKGRIIVYSLIRVR